MSNPNLLAKEWENFASHVPSSAATPGARHTFYAGAWCLYKVIMKANPQTEDPERMKEAALNLMSGIEEELVSYMSKAVIDTAKEYGGGNA